MTELELIIDLHRKTSRQGPGSDAATLRALQLTGLTEATSLRVADLGCGNGGPTLTLARHLDGQITAVDLFPEFLRELEKRALKLGLSERVATREQSMAELSFAPASLDLIWSEGAIYNVGFQNGIQQWREFLKPGGYLVVSEITWITNERPKAVEDFWLNAYTEINTAGKKIEQLEQNGYTLAGYFYLPQSCWTEEYYGPLSARFPGFLAANHYAELAQKVVRDQQEEIDLYEQYGAYYSYGFYVARKAEEG